MNAIWQGPVDQTGAHLTAGDMPRGSEPSWIGSMVTAPEGARFSGRAKVQGLRVGHDAAHSTLIEFDSAEQVVGANDSPAYQAVLAAPGKH